MVPLKTSQSEMLPMGHTHILPLNLTSRQSNKNRTNKKRGKAKNDLTMTIQDHLVRMSQKTSMMLKTNTSLRD